MSFEVELKFPVDDWAALQQRLLDCGVQWRDSVYQADRYFAHPCRDFSQTDEALRIRQVGTSNCLTYKGPKIDALTKTRREIELPVQEGQQVAEAWEQLLAAVGFTPVACVQKRRQRGTLAWQSATVDIALDEVEGVGRFIELELVADDQSLDAARQRILSLAEHLGLSGVERRSYLEMFLERQSPHRKSTNQLGGTA